LIIILPHINTSFETRFNCRLAWEKKCGIIWSNNVIGWTCKQPK